jgi:deoxyribodipyrimidine photo-lyase
MIFATQYAEILQQLDSIDPIRYGKTRNYLDGAVTRLSPYLSRGVISTRQVARHILAKGYKPYEIESFLKELAWRDYFQQVWMARGNDINQDLKQPQPDCRNYQVSKAIVEARTGISAVDKGIAELIGTGYMHNHLRMYVASIACNIAKSHWLNPAQWMYFYLLDADWASNALSWQWVAGSFSSKKYFANQENINKYCYTADHYTFLDISYEAFDDIEVPEILNEVNEFRATTILPTTPAFEFKSTLPVYVYNFYNLDPEWDAAVEANRVLLLEPSMFGQYPVSEKTIQFILQLAENIPDMRVCTGEFEEVFKNVDSRQIHFKEHPLNAHYRGNRHSRNWMFEAITGYYPSFFSYWKKCEKHLSDLMS